MNRRTVLVLPLAVAAGCAGRTIDLNLYRSSALIGDAFVEASLAEVDAFQQTLIRPDAHIDIQRIFWGVGHSLLALQEWLLKGDGFQAAGQVSKLLDAVAFINAKLVIVPDNTRIAISRGIDAARSTLAVWSMFVGNVKKPERTMSDFAGSGQKLAMRSFDILSDAPGIVAAHVSSDVTAVSTLGNLTVVNLRRATLDLRYTDNRETRDIIDYRRGA